MVSYTTRHAKPSLSAKVGLQEPTATELGNHAARALWGGLGIFPQISLEISLTIYVLEELRSGCEGMGTW